MAVAPEKNPLVIQAFDSSESGAPIPLVLLPGGGATVYKFFLLDDLRRRVLAFWDPNIALPAPAFTTLRDMACHFVDILRSEMEPGPILLGGWSCGGNMALEAAHILASDHCGFEVVGLVIIDTGFPDFDDKDLLSTELQSLKMPLSPDIPHESQLAILKAMDNAQKMLASWHAPQWDGVVGDAGRASHQADGRREICLPNAVLFRAIEDVGGVGERTAKLGWEAYPYDFIKSVLDIGGNHFTLFDEENIRTLSEKLRVICDGFERDFYARMPKTSPG